jgi:hypothetical protein
LKRAWRLNVPFKLLVPFIYGAYYFSILLFVALSPLVLLYSTFICVLAWFMWASPTHEMLVVYNSESRRSEYLTHLAPLIEGRAVFLDYRQRRNWPWLSISTQLFHHFGPKPIPERFIIHHLPAVIVVRRFEWPKKFTFGERSRREENLAALQRNLVGGRSATL